MGAVGVMNSTLYSSAQMLYGLSRFGLVSEKFSALHPKYGTPARCIWFTAAFVVLTPFTGKLLFLPLINIASLATGGRITAVCGILASVFLAGNLLVPFSPGALNGLEYALAAALAVLGLVLYHFRDRSLSDTERARRILGGREKTP